jgi:hypothetical protein
VGASRTELIQILEWVQLAGTKLMGSDALVRFHHAALSVAYGLSIFAVLGSVLFSWALARGSGNRRLF